MGKNRELKKATEAYWSEKISREELLKEGKRLRLEHWQIQKNAGVDIIPSNDFAFYDQVLDHIQLFGVGDLPHLSGRTDANRVSNRSSRRGTGNTTSTPLMSTLPWAVVCRSPPRMVSLQLMFPVWYDGW